MAVITYSLWILVWPKSTETAGRSNTYYTEKIQISLVLPDMPASVHVLVLNSFRDDMESSGQVLMYFARTNLPWQGLKAATKKRKYGKISERKMSTPVEVLRKGFPTELAWYLNSCPGLHFQETPSSMHVRQLFHIRVRTLNHQCDCTLDLTILKQKAAQVSLFKCSGSAAPSPTGF